MNLSTRTQIDKGRKRRAFYLLLVTMAMLALAGCSELEDALGEGESLLASASYLASVDGLVELSAPDQQDGAWTTAADGSEIATGSRLRTADGEATITFADGSTAELAPTSEIAVTEVDLGPETEVQLIRLEQAAGRTRHVVVDDDADVVYQVQTPEGITATTAGTFLVELPAPGQTHVVVSDGVVQTSAVDGVQHVAAGRATTLVAGGPPAVGTFVFQARGLLTEMTAETITVAGRVINLHAATFLQPGLEINQVVFVQGRVAEDGSLIADRVLLAGAVDDLAIVGDKDRSFTLDDRDCVLRSGVVVGLDGDALLLEDGTRLAVEDLEVVDGEIALYDTVLIIACRDADGATEIRVVVLDRTDEAPDESGQITICHVPSDGGNEAETVMVAETAVAEHMLHGDYVGGCTQQVFFGDGEPDAGVSKVTICHRPPGNPANEHTITIGEPAVDAHLAHGDVVGACANGNGPPNGNGNKSNPGKGNSSSRGPRSNS
jgi:hypothetical protein